MSIEKWKDRYRWNKGQAMKERRELNAMRLEDKNWMTTKGKLAAANLIKHKATKVRDLEARAAECRDMLCAMGYEPAKHW